MSHFTKIKTKLYDRTTIERSLSDLNIDWEAGVKPIKGYNNQEIEADIIIHQKNNHDIGFKWDNNQYELVADLMFWEQQYPVDKFLNQVHQRYAFNLITRVSEEQGLQLVETEKQETGSIRLVLRKFS